jgi:membrane-bound ClpP family serine protease
LSKKFLILAVNKKTTTFTAVLKKNMDIAIIITLLIIGIFLLLAEIFLLPGMIAGISGMLMAAGAIIFAYMRIGTMTGHLTLAFSLLLFLGMFWYFVRSKSLDRIFLQTEIDGKIEPLKGLDIEVGAQGMSLSRLAPMGKVKINGAVVEAKSLEGFIDEGKEVEVLKVLSTNVIVRKL